MTTQIVTRRRRLTELLMMMIYGHKRETPKFKLRMDRSCSGGGGGDDEEEKVEAFPHYNYV